MLDPSDHGRPTVSDQREKTWQSMSCEGVHAIQKLCLAKHIGSYMAAVWMTRKRIQEGPLLAVGIDWDQTSCR